MRSNHLFAASILVVLAIGVSCFFLSRLELVKAYTPGLMQEHEFSVVQALEWTYRDKPHDSMPLIERAERSDTVAIGLPLADKADGYAWLIANPSTSPKIKMMPPQAKFILTKDGLHHIEATIHLDSTVQAFLEQHTAN